MLIQLRNLAGEDMERYTVHHVTSHVISRLKSPARSTTFSFSLVHFETLMNLPLTTPTGSSTTPELSIYPTNT